MDQMDRRLPCNMGDLQFPKTYIDEICHLNNRECLPGIAKLLNKKIPTLCLRVPAEDMEYFGIVDKPFLFDWRFRYLDNQKSELIEIPLLFQGRKLLAILLDPLNENVRVFLEKTKKIRNFGFLFYSKEKQLFTGTFSMIDEEIYTWLGRNGIRARNLSKNDFESILSTRKQIGKSTERFYPGKNITTMNFSQTKKNILVPFEKIKEYLW